MFFFGSIILTNFYIFAYGKLIHNLFFHKYKITISEFGIYGCFILSFISLFLNFFTPINEIISTIILLIPFIFLFKIKFNFKDDFFFILISSILTTLILAYSNVNTPDAGLYHLPYIQTINENKIIFGLGNIHFRFSHISIVQYLSAININYLIGIKGILIPSASLMIFIFMYFIKQCHDIKKVNDFTIKDFFDFSILIYISYKINRYSGFGNDAIAHLLFFYLISQFLKVSENYENLYKTSLISIFIFLNKITLIFSFFFPLFLFLKNKEKKLKILFSFPMIFLILWLIKNILVSGCLIFPLKQTCFNNLLWSDSKLVSQQNISGEAWSKGWPNKIEDFTQEDFIKKFNWIEAWSSVHFKYILKVIVPYIIFLLIIIICINYFKIEKFKKFRFIKIDKLKIIFIFIILILSNLIFFIKFPLYRYGYSYLITLIIFLLSLCILRYELKFTKNIINFILIFCIIVFCTKQIIRINKNYNTRTFWPNIYSFIPSKIDQIPNAIKIKKKFTIFTKDRECMYNQSKFSPCTNIFNKNIKHKLFFNYNVIYNDK